MPANIIAMPVNIIAMPVNIIVMPASERASPYTIFYNYSREQFALLMSFRQKSMAVQVSTSSS